MRRRPRAGATMRRMPGAATERARGCTSSAPHATSREATKVWWWCRADRSSRQNSPILRPPVALANASTLGSLGDLLLAPVIGNLSECYGRRPVLLFYATMPTLMRLAIGLVTHPALQLQLLFADVVVAQGFGVKRYVMQMIAAVDDVHSSWRTSAWPPSSGPSSGNSSRATLFLRLSRGLALVAASSRAG